MAKKAIENIYKYYKSDKEYKVPKSALEISKIAGGFEVIGRWDDVTSDIFTSTGKFHSIHEEGKKYPKLKSKKVK